MQQRLEDLEVQALERAGGKAVKKFGRRFSVGRRDSIKAKGVIKDVKAERKLQRSKSKIPSASGHGGEGPKATPAKV